MKIAFCFCLLIATVGCSGELVNPPVRSECEADVTSSADVSADAAAADVQTVVDAAAESGVDAATATDASDSGTSDVSVPPPGSLVYRSVGGRGDFWFCGEYAGHDPHVYGYRGCCTNGRWLRQEDFGRAPGFYAGTSVRTPNSETTYYIFSRRDGSLARIMIPTSRIRVSWTSHPDLVHAEIMISDPRDCANVYEADEAQLSMLPIVGVLLFRSGTVFTGVGTSSQRYIAGPNRTLHPIRFRGSPEIPPMWIRDYVSLLPDFIFSNYSVVGAPIDIDGSESPATVLSRYSSEERLVDPFNL